MSNNISYNNSGDVDNNKIKNSDHVFINSPQQKISENKTTVYKNIRYPKRMSNNEKEKLMKETQRPLLKDNHGKRITCFGLTVCKYKYNDCYTVINIVDKNGNYIADHIQLDYREDLYNYDGQLPLKDNFIRFTGIVNEYHRSNGSSDYGIEITDRVFMTSSDLYYDEEIINYEEVDIDYNRISEYINSSNMTKIYDIIDKLRHEINKITSDLLPNDYIFYYIINQYFLNQATYNIYEGTFRDQGFDENCVLDIMILLGHTLFDLKDREKTYLYDLFELIVFSCNILQGIYTLSSYKDNIKFIDFCTNRLNCKGKRKISSLWHFISLRHLNFNLSDPKHPKLTKDMMTYRAYHMINNYI